MHFLPAYSAHTPEQQYHLARAASLMQAAITYITTFAVNTSKYPFFNTLSQFIAKHQLRYLPENPRRLREKILTIIASLPNCQIVELIKLPRQGNEFAKRYDDSEIRAWILQLRIQGANYTNTFIINKIQQMCTLTTKPCPSPRWIGSIMEEHNTRYLTAAGRFGASGSFAKIYQGYQPFANALHAGDCWQIDGTRFNIVEHTARRPQRHDSRTPLLHQRRPRSQLPRH